MKSNTNQARTLALVGLLTSHQHQMPIYQTDTTSEHTQNESKLLRFMLGRYTLHTGTGYITSGFGKLWSEQYNTFRHTHTHTHHGHQTQIDTCYRFRTSSISERARPRLKRQPHLRSVVGSYNQRVWGVWCLYFELSRRKSFKLFSIIVSRGRAILIGVVLFYFLENIIRHYIAYAMGKVIVILLINLTSNGVHRLYLS